MASTPLLWRIIKKLRALQIKVFQRNTPAGNLVLLLTTTGRKSGLERVTPLQYEEHDGKIYVASARGEKADWYRNIIANPEVRVEIKGRQIDGFAEPVTDPERIADFLEMRLNKHPFMVRMIMIIAGLPLRYNRSDLIRYAANRTIVTIHLLDTRESNSPGIK